MKGNIFIYRLQRVAKPGELCLNKDGVFNQPDSAEDCLKSAQHFGNQPISVFLVETVKPEFGELFIPQCANTNLNGKLFLYNDISVRYPGKIRLLNEDGYTTHTIDTVFTNCKTVIGKAPDHILDELVGGKLKDGDTVEIWSEPKRPYDIDTNLICE